MQIQERSKCRFRARRCTIVDRLDHLAVVLEDSIFKQEWRMNEMSSETREALLSTAMPTEDHPTGLG